MRFSTRRYPRLSRNVSERLYTEACSARAFGSRAQYSRQLSRIVDSRYGTGNALILYHVRWVTALMILFAVLNM